MRKLLLLGAFIYMSFFTACCTPEAQDDREQKIDLMSQKKSSETPYADTILRLGRIPFTNATEMVHKHNRFLEHMTEVLGVRDTRLRTASDYSGIMDLIDRGDIDIAWLGTMSSAEARHNPNIKLIAKPVRFGSTSYRGLIITRQDSGINRLTDLRGKSVAWVEPESASGYLFPKALLIDAGVDPEKDLERTEFLGTHDAVVLNVALGRFDAGACYDDARENLRDESQAKQLRILASTPDISNEAIVVRSNLPSDLIEKIKRALLELDINTPLGKEVLAELTNVQGFVPANEQDYDYIEHVQNLLETQQENLRD